MSPTQHDHTTGADEATQLVRKAPRFQRTQIALIVGSALALAALRSTTGRTVLLLGAAGLTGCVSWGLLAR
ncbi:hypothetical protein [Glycomyces buryatensis]|uniref:Uncharacterized protein n=1 Tax=Glycomyces buryatensis TaxID=2570927 RepID=A0A4S8QG78_9ACTN|nr:hypothetical protein [Glycomyces buryatensis]THV39654.1 hypothetical protein FAB82_17445 [Glycomyces buryatensis]